MSSDNAIFASIFMPRAMGAYSQIAQPLGPDFVHYTSAENFINITKSKPPSIWMRNAKCMNDISEIHHGLERIDAALGNNKRFDRLKEALNNCHEGAGDEAFSIFKSHLPNFLNDTYITSVSVHHHYENDIGRLSMWRAYGQGSVGVAIVLNKAPFLSDTDYLQAFSSPVAYINDEELASDLETIIANIEHQRAYLTSKSKSDFISMIFNMLKFGVICMKHPGFSEEQEWRIIHTPTTSSKRPLESSIETVGGIPQRIFKITLKDYTENNVAFDISPNNLIKRVIIGPSNYPEIIRDAAIETLGNIGVVQPQDRVVISDIPLRMLL